ncbi:MAG: methyltransferase domain-containing protein [Gammaproteobacteria bacterium]|nr:methyltransferase domain-containing protein [Gammaproteobacteria bacterium]MDH5730277.1 methyltransferase domain-containing protein [Gammaproteobacteria bacterium]
MLKNVIKNVVAESIRQDSRHLLRQFKKLSSNTYHQLVHSHRLRKAISQCEDCRINFGCGDLVRPGWINIDASGRPGTYYYDLRNEFPISSEQISHINAEHFLEHLEFYHALRFLKECFRVLKPNGTFRIIVPDAEKYMLAYAKDDKSFYEPLVNLGGTPIAMRTKTEIVNTMFRMSGSHLFAWDFETLSLHLNEAGFKNICRSKYRQGENNIDGDDWWRPHESLYVVAEK